MDGLGRPRMPAYLAFFEAPPGQHFGHGPAPRNLCPRLQVFQPLAVRDCFFFLSAMVSDARNRRAVRGVSDRCPQQLGARKTNPYRYDRASMPAVSVETL